MGLFKRSKSTGTTGIYRAAEVYLDADPDGDIRAQLDEALSTQRNDKLNPNFTDEDTIHYDAAEGFQVPAEDPVAAQKALEGFLERNRVKHLGRAERFRRLGVVQASIVSCDVTTTPTVEVPEVVSPSLVGIKVTAEFYLKQLDNN